MSSPRISCITPWPCVEISPLDLNSEKVVAPPITNHSALEATSDRSTSKTDHNAHLLFQDIALFLMKKDVLEALSLRAKMLQSVADLTLAGLRKDKSDAEKKLHPVCPYPKSPKTCAEENQYISGRSEELFFSLHMEHIHFLDKEISRLCSARIELPNLLAQAQEDLKAGKTPQDILADSKVSDGWIWFLRNLSVGWWKSQYTNSPKGPEFREFRTERDPKRKGFSAMGMLDLYTAEMGSLHGLPGGPLEISAISQALGLPISVADVMPKSQVVNPFS